MKQIQAKKSFNRMKISGHIFCYALLAYPILLFLVFYVYAHLDGFVMAFQHIQSDGTRTFAGFSNFTTILNDIKSDGLIGISIKNSLLMYAINFVISMPLYIFFSYLLFKKAVGHKLVSGLMITPAVVSGFVFALVFKNFASSPLQQIMQSFGFKNFPNLIDDLEYAFGTGLFYMIWASFYSSLLVYSNAMRNIDPAIIESAQIDGMSTMFQELWYIILPLIYPTLTTFIVTGVAGIFTAQGPLVLFYADAAPAEVYNVGYYMFKEIAYKSYSPIGFPLISAMGMLLTLIIAPLTRLVNYLMEKFSPLKEV